jgi:hypothetical protein
VPGCRAQPSHSKISRPAHPSLPAAFTDFPALLTGASVSPFFQKIYELKTNDLQRKLANLDAVLTRHNFYDCQTILELRIRRLRAGGFSLFPIWM